jgi:ATP-dependent DNA helicase RecQ
MTQQLFEQAEAELKDKWGFDKFRAAQEYVVQCALDGEDVLAILPTGYGKSAAFQIPALVQPGCALVVSPLIALMKDQTDDCLAKGISASFVNSHISTEEMEDRLRRLQEGAYKVFYVAPERLGMAAFRAALVNTEINFLVVDEAHCSSQWGHDFRPSYMRIHQVVEVLESHNKRPPVIAVTATATMDIEDDIAKAIGMCDDYSRIVADPIRPNLRYQVQYGSPWSSIKRIASDWADTLEDSRYIVYTATRKGAEKVSEIIEGQLGSGSVGFYHAGMARGPRTEMQEEFKGGKTPIIVATSAFGMGIDVPNIRSVIHFGIPGSLEDYTQQSGRAGRDGKDSDVILLADEDSVRIQQFFLDNNNPPTHLYPVIWSWLRKELQDKKGGKLRLSARSISMRVFKDTEHRVSGDQVSTILSILESHKFVNRTYAERKTPIMFRPSLLRRVVKGEVRLRPNTTRLANHLWKAQEMAGKKDSFEVLVNKDRIRAATKMSESALRTSLRSLHDEGILTVGTTFTGKTTEISDWDVENIEDALPVDQLQAKRDRDQDRLDRMVTYMNAPDPIKMIRDYFLKGKSTAEETD